MRVVQLIAMVALLIVSAGCACHSSWFGNCQPSTPLDDCIVKCPHPNQVVSCPVDSGASRVVALPCADCCVARFGAHR